MSKRPTLRARIEAKIESSRIILGIAWIVFGFLALITFGVFPH